MKQKKLTIALIALVSFLVFLNLQTVSSLRARTRERDEAKARFSRRNRKQQKRSEKPNIVIIMTDDQDTELGKSLICIHISGGKGTSIEKS